MLHMMLRLFGSGFVLLLAILAVSLLVRQPNAPAQSGDGLPGGSSGAAGTAGQPAAEPVPPTAAAGQVVLEFDEATLTRQANTAMSGMAIAGTPLGSATVRDLAVQLRAGQIGVTGTAQVGPTPLPLQLGGTVQVQNGRPRLVLSDARISGVQMPQAARQSVEGTLQTQLDSLIAGQPVRLSSATAGNGKLTLIGSRT